MDNNGFPDILKWRYTPSTSTSLDDTYDTQFDTLSFNFNEYW